MTTSLPLSVPTQSVNVPPRSMAIRIPRSWPALAADVSSDGMMRMTQNESDCAQDKMKAAKLNSYGLAPAAVALYNEAGQRCVSWAQLLVERDTSRSL